MRFGVSGDLLPDDMDAFDMATAQRVRDLGFSGVFTRFGANDPFTTTRAQCQRVRDLLEAHGLRMYQATGYWQPLIHTDEAVRAHAVRTVQAALRMAGWLGARAIDTGPGSFSARGPWAPHPQNWTAQARAALVRSLCECAGTAEEFGVLLCLEGHQLVTVDSAETARAVLDAVDSPWIKADFDPVNWITLRDIYATGPAIARMMTTLGAHIVSAHAKDIVLEDRLTVHLDERPAGHGLLDYRAFLRAMEHLDPTFPIIVEGAAIDELPAVKAFLDRVAAESNIRVW